MMRQKKILETHNLFIETVWKFYREHGRHELPWRNTADPYKILVSEVMLQQTQVARVIPKYYSFLKKFPSIKKLSTASLGEVLREWQGLGYNRRAKMLHSCAQSVTEENHGVFPRTVNELKKLPGIGQYTAGAVCVFAYNTPALIIETNIRTVFLHHFFKHQSHVDDKEVMLCMERLPLMDNPREWYAALMDYGSYLKSMHGNQNIRSKQYVKQTPFEGSGRQIRGAIIRLLSIKEMSFAKISRELSQYEPDFLQVQLNGLLHEDLIQKYQRSYRLPQ